jgi:hypothetical protein
MLKRKEKRRQPSPRRLETLGGRRVMDGGQKGEARVARSLPVWLSLTSLFSGDLLPLEITSHHRLQKEKLTVGCRILGSPLTLLRMVNLRNPHFQPPLGFRRPRKESRWNSGGSRPAGKVSLCANSGDMSHILQKLASICLISSRNWSSGGSNRSPGRKTS